MLGRISHHKHGGQGWLMYDAAFRRNHKGVSSRWNVLDPSLHTAYITGQNLPPRMQCKHCNEPDHGPEDCALAPLPRRCGLASGSAYPWDHGPLNGRSLLTQPTTHRPHPKGGSAYRGTGVSVPSRGLAPSATPAQYATAQTTRPGTAPALLLTPSTTFPHGAATTPPNLSEWDRRTPNSHSLGDLDCIWVFVILSDAS